MGFSGKRQVYLIDYNSMLARQMVVHSRYGDPAYSINSFLLSPCQGAHITKDQQQWNQSMSQLRIVAECTFKEMVTTFGFLDYVKNQKHLLQPVGIQFGVVALLHNAHVCLHRPQITQYFQNLNQYFQNLNQPELEENEESPLDQALLEPPTLIEYFHNKVSPLSQSKLQNLFYHYNLAYFPTFCFKLLS